MLDPEERKRWVLALLALDDPGSTPYHRVIAAYYTCPSPVSRSSIEADLLRLILLDPTEDDITQIKQRILEVLWT